MMNEIVVATHNKGKLSEFRKLLEELNITVKALTEFEDIAEVEEDGNTFEENAIKKAETIRDILHLPVIADDSGLAVDYLNGEPGIYSARYAGPEKDDNKNIEKLLVQLTGVEKSDRTAQFVSAIALAIPNKPTIVVKGTVKGIIGFEAKGSNGFGYDPIFYLPDYDKIMAEIPPELKNKISHRARAMENLRKAIDKNLSQQ